MELKTRNMLRLAFWIEALVVTFIPRMYCLQAWKYDNSIVYHGKASLTFKESRNLFKSVFSASGVFILFGVVVYLIILCCLVLSLKAYLQKGKKQNIKSELVINCVGVIFYMILLLFVTMYHVEGTYWDFRYEPLELFWMQMVLLLIYISFFIYSYMQFNKKGSDLFNVEEDDSFDYVEELLKYKNLLDEGIITDEEFTRKKRDLLGL